MVVAGDNAAHQGQAERQNGSDAAEPAQAAGAPSQAGNSQALPSGEAPAAPRDAGAGETPAESPTKAAAEDASRRPAKAEAGAEPMKGTEPRTSDSVLAAPEGPLAAELHSAKSASSALQQEAAAVLSTPEGSGELHMHTEAAESKRELLAAEQLKQEPTKGAHLPAGAPQGATSETDVRHATDTQQRLPAASAQGDSAAAIVQEVSVKELVEAPTSAQNIGCDMAAEASAAGGDNTVAEAGDMAAEAGGVVAEASDQPADCTTEAKQASADQPSMGVEDGLTQDDAATAAAEHGGPAEKEAAVEGTAEDDHVRVIYLHSLPYLPDRLSSCGQSWANWPGKAWVAAAAKAC